MRRGARRRIRPPGSAGGSGSAGQGHRSRAIGSRAPRALGAWRVADRRGVRPRGLGGAPSQAVRGRPRCLMRLLYVCLDRGLPLGAPKGGSVHVAELLRAFEAEGHETAVLARSAAGAYEASRPTLLASLREGPHWLPAPVLRRDLREVRGRARLSRAVEEAIERFRPDLIYERYALFRSEALQAARSAGTPLVVEVNAPLVEEARRFHGLRFTKSAVRAE